MRILLWHGWLLEGTGSNIYTARVAEVLRRQGHEVLVLCQQPRPERLPFVDAWGTAGPDGVSRLQETGARGAGGRFLLIRPEIGSLLPVFVYDEYEGFEVKRFVDLEDRELGAYFDRNVVALRAVAERFPPDVVIAGHAVPGPVVARRALGAGTYVAKMHGSDLEYAVRVQDRYRDLAREGLEGARAVVGASRDVLVRTVEVAPSVADRTMVVPPGVDVERWRPLPRIAALETAASLLDADPDVSRGRPGATDERVRRALADRDAGSLDDLARSYDQAVPDPDAALRLRELAGHQGPVVGYLGKLIPQKGVDRYVQALALAGGQSRGLVVGFGLFREWLAALVHALDGMDAAAVAWLRESSPMHLELDDAQMAAAAGLARRVAFTGRLDHRYAPEAVAAMDVLVVPSTLDEAFGMVAAEGAAAGALPLVARHSSLAEVAEALEGAVGTPRLLSFEPGPGTTGRLAEALGRLLALPDAERQAYRRAVRAYVAEAWTWEGTARQLVEAALSS